jgi:hypothetical protein
VEDLLPAFGNLDNQIGEKNPVAVGLARIAWDDLLELTWKKIVDFETKDLAPALVNITTWIGEHLPGAIRGSREAWETFNGNLQTLYDRIYPVLLGPDGALTKMYKYFNEEIAQPIWDAVNGPLAALIGAFKTIGEWLGGIVSDIGKLIEKLLELGNIKIPNIFGSKGRIEIGLEGIARAFGLAGDAAVVFGNKMEASMMGGDIMGALTGLAGTISGRFKSKYVGPLEEQQRAIAERIARYQEAQLGVTNPAEYAMYNQQIAKAQKEYTELTEELNKYKEQELALEKQLADLQFLQQQMAFVDFLRENELDMADILGDLQLGLDMDLPAFMAAMEEAIRQLVENLNMNLNGGVGQLPGDGFAGGKPLGGGMAVYNNQSVTINMNVALNNGMDTESFRVMVLDTVSGALR